MSARRGSAPSGLVTIIGGLGHETTKRGKTRTLEEYVTFLGRGKYPTEAAKQARNAGKGGGADTTRPT